MEWLNKKGLRQSFFIITGLFLCLGILFAGITFFICLKAQTNLSASPNFEISLDGEGKIISEKETAENPQAADPGGGLWNLVTLLQFILPVLWIILSLISAAIVFYNLKLKRPLAVLQAGASRIQRHDLDFHIESCAQDELGQLCESFEIMRKELQKNNQELWRQMEERKRLNAAFAHDLRNPITVLKGSAKILQKEAAQDSQIHSPIIKESISLITEYTARIESYAALMTNAQKLEEIECRPLPCDTSALHTELERALTVLTAGQNKKVIISNTIFTPQVHIDKQFLFDTAENLVNNALRYAFATVQADVSYQQDNIQICVTDDGPGYPDTILKKGPTPFFRENPSGNEHFGMGLYICKLLCDKHQGGSLTLENTSRGAKATAVFRTAGPLCSHSSTP
ncbi:HAMP domain-containing sensor histidine kinase [Diplocloster hominis]|uniref:HAMP domain-containing sensor histidine kinase n=1 Tax=Diplocloster hominis TaxID=3079010 RepID=UPI0031BA88B5